MKKLFGILVLLSVFAGSVYAYWRNDFDKPINVCANHILVKDETMAQRLKLEIKDYDDFTQLATIYSECPSSRNGGYLGCFGRKQMVKEFETAAFDGNIGEVIGPVKTQFGYHLIWVTRKY
jgi:peptidyl-prolyl cis-trans isomerase C